MTAVTISRWQRTAWQARRLVTAYNNNLSLFQKYLTTLAAAVFLVSGWWAVSSWSSLFAEAYQGKTLALADYRLVGEPIELQIMTYNASGLTYNRDTDSLFAVANNPPYVVEMDKQGQELRKIPLEGFDDTEGMVFLGNGRYAIIEEDHRSVVIVGIDAETTTLNRANGRSVSFPLTQKNNKGFEGVAYNAADQSLYVVNERQPREIYRIAGAVDPDALSFSITTPWSMEDNSLGNSDLSGLHFDQGTGHLLVLSDESKALTETTTDGRKVSRLSLSDSGAGFGESVPQAEGVTMDDDGMLYILSEPNLLYRLAPPQAPVAAKSSENPVSASKNQAKSG
ncbi:SdiA-regulated domain-containing protein [Aestuariicella sp. G3-2]|uniref:SdiA-regulated domain-containing protein n=1 Tax=Pseudomaricurvus albidus TaxID=2842452 RepID=UPI001C0E1290|nr:SdiA-regulated domain-containing protein [Aestuariicella albida]MBU3071398.1 SdiA-regulated domain-containing protein [Aestuariicella albida]